MNTANAMQTPQRTPVIPNAQLGMMLLVGSLTVLFACFISAYMVLRMSSPMWPPAGSPILPIGLASVNTSVLLLSAIIAAFSGRQLGLLPVTLALGVLFVILQVVEFFLKQTSTGGLAIPIVIFALGMPMR